MQFQLELHFCFILSNRKTLLFQINCSVNDTLSNLGDIKAGYNCLTVVPCYRQSVLKYRLVGK